MAAHPLYSEVGLAGIGWPEDRLDHTIVRTTLHTVLLASCPSRSKLARSKCTPCRYLESIGRNLSADLL